MAQFKEGNIRALIATDIASRGLDIEALPYVMNFELPSIPEDLAQGRANGKSRKTWSCGEFDFRRRFIQTRWHRETDKTRHQERVHQRLFTRGCCNIRSDAKKVRVARDRKYRKEAANKDYKKKFKNKDDAVKSTERGMSHRRPSQARAAMALKTATRDGLKKGSKKKASKRR